MQNSTDYLVTVCVITYNHQDYIRKCLDSIVSQKTNFKFNVLVSDDCSKDDTLNILKSYEEKYPNLKAISRCGREKSYYNGKPTGNANFIENLSEATGKYIAVCDGDDYWQSTEKLQIQIDHLERNPELGLVCSARDKLKNGIFIPNKIVLPDLIFSSRLLCFYNPLPTSSVVFRKENFSHPSKWYFDSLDVGDWPLWFKVTRGQKILRLSKAYALYRIHDGGIWGLRKKSERALSALNVVRLLRTENSDPLLVLSNFLHFIRYKFHTFREGLFP